MIFHSKACLINLLIIVSFYVAQVSSLECYVCEEQEDNGGKCVSTVNSCEYNQDRCLSTISWGSTLYWETGAPMQFYISKQCADQKRCEEVHNKTIGLCQRIEWRDWNCTECCQGDRCNYYITMGSSSVHASLLLLSVSSFVPWFLL